MAEILTTIAVGALYLVGLVLVSIAVGVTLEAAKGAGWRVVVLLVAGAMALVGICYAIGSWLR